jgi:hypothetical protein
MARRKVGNMQINITYPSVTDYMDRVVGMASKYGKDQWWELNADEMEPEDRDRFNFIQMAVWDQLWQMEFPAMAASPPGQCLTDSFAFQTQPGENPGCSVYGGSNWTRLRMLSLSSAN